MTSSRDGLAIPDEHASNSIRQCARPGRATISLLGMRLARGVHEI